MIDFKKSRKWTVAALFAISFSSAQLAFGVETKSDENKLKEVKIGINWQGDASSIAAALAAYVGIPYVDAGGSDDITIQQEKDATLADAINAINKQLHPKAYLRLANTPLRLELAELPAQTTAPNAPLPGTPSVTTTPVMAAVATPTGSTPDTPVPTREQVAGMFTEAQPAPAKSWVEQAREDWKTSFTTEKKGNAFPVWEVQLKDITLAKTFARWSATAGYRVRWDAAKQVEIGGPDTYEMPFEEAVQAALSTPGIVHSEYPLEVCFYPNNPPLARITRKGAQEKECK